MIRANSEIIKRRRINQVRLNGGVYRQCSEGEICRPTRAISARDCRQDSKGIYRCLRRLKKKTGARTKKKGYKHSESSGLDPGHESSYNKEIEFYKAQLHECKRMLQKEINEHRNFREQCAREAKTSNIGSMAPAKKKRAVLMKTVKPIKGNLTKKVGDGLNLLRTVTDTYERLTGAPDDVVLTQVPRPKNHGNRRRILRLWNSYLTKIRKIKNLDWAKNLTDIVKQIRENDIRIPNLPKILTELQVLGLTRDKMKELGIHNPENVENS